MAYLSSEARAASNGEFGRGGHGYLESHWHNMPHAIVEQLPADDSRGDLEIRWAVDYFDRVVACLTVSEARRLRDNLTAAITTVEGPNSSVTDNGVDDAVTVNGDGTALTLETEPVFCYDCGGRISLVSDGINHWWTHEPHSINDHEPVQDGPALCTVCGKRIELIGSPHDHWWAHEVDPFDEHTAVPGRVVTLRSGGEAA